MGVPVSPASTSSADAEGSGPAYSEGSDGPDDSEFMAEFMAERSRLWGLAYRICGTRSDADDVVQDAWLRWQGVDRSTIDRPPAWLTTVTSRLSIDRLRSRRRDAEHYVGPWLPEMISTGADDPADLVSSLTLGFLTMLERLEPIERVVFLLADVFDESFHDIAVTVDRTEAACRQIASRGRKKLRDPNRRRDVDPADQWRLAEAFSMAMFNGDLRAIEALLTPESVLLSDGGANTRAARRPVVGPHRIARFVATLARRHPQMRGEPAVLNGEPGALLWSGSKLDFAAIFHTSAGTDGEPLVEQIFLLRNPDKLVGLAQERLSSGS